MLHDFTFDVKLLADAGVVLANLRDTSVLARMLGRKATGLPRCSRPSSASWSKELQQHDWSQGPSPRSTSNTWPATSATSWRSTTSFPELARAVDIEEEALVECAFKYEMAIAPPREKRPAYLRIKGIDALDTVGLAVLRRLVEERERLAEQWDVPPFKVAGNDLLLILARAGRPRSKSWVGCDADVSSV